MLETRTRDNLGRLVSANRTGRRHGRWFIMHYLGKKMWLCRCDCGTIKPVRGDHLDSRHCQSCGCLHRELASKQMTTHGMTHTPTYRSWTHMLERCHNPKHHAFSSYGGAGITVCHRWVSFEIFLQDMGKRPSLDHSIDRFPDPGGNYEPNNCRWATPVEQASNMRSNRNLTWNNHTQILVEWSKQIGITPAGLRWRLENWSLEKAMTEPLRPYPPKRSA